MHAGHIQALGVVRIIVLGAGDLLLALFDKLGVVEVAQVRRDAVIVAAVLGAGHFLAAEQGLPGLLAVAGADDLHRVIRLAQQAGEGLGQHLDGGGRRLLHEDVAVLAVLEGVEHQVHGVGQRHHEAGHGRIGDGERLAGTHLLNEQRDDRTARGHDITVTSAANDSLEAVEVTGLGHHDLFHHGLGDPHGIDWVDGLVSAQADHTLHAVLDSGLEHVLGAEDVSLDGFHGMELAGRHLLERGGVEDVIDATGGIQDTLVITHIANVELELGVSVALSHVVLFLFITAKNPDFGNIRL